MLRVVDGARRMFAPETSHGEASGGGSHGEMLFTTIQVSRRAAAAGAVVPCDLTLRDICGSCGGRGESWSEPCSRCATAGYVVVRRRIRLAVPSGVSDGAMFRFRLPRANQASVQVDVRVVVHPYAS